MGLIKQVFFSIACFYCHIAWTIVCAVGGIDRRRPHHKYLNFYTFVFAITSPATNNREHTVSRHKRYKECVKKRMYKRERRGKAHKPEANELALFCRGILQQCLKRNIKWNANTSVTMPNLKNSMLSLLAARWRFLWSAQHNLYWVFSSDWLLFWTAPLSMFSPGNRISSIKSCVIVNLLPHRVTCLYLKTEIWKIQKKSTVSLSPSHCNCLSHTITYLSLVKMVSH